MRETKHRRVIYSLPGSCVMMEVPDVVPTFRCPMFEFPGAYSGTTIYCIWSNTYT